MKYFKESSSGLVYAYESDGSQDEWIKTDLTPMTEAEVELHLNPPTAPAYKTVFSVLEFRDRFTIEEQLLIRQTQFTDMEVGLVFDAFQAASYIDIEDPRVIHGLDLYVSKGLLSESRKIDLLTPEVLA